jgi:oligopeptide/dipeptide ABC transporter ATP-binding protein
MTPLLQIRGLDVTFRRPKLLPWSDPHEVRAVRGLDLDVSEHETVGLVGESGSGKTTTGRALLHLVPIAAGTVRLGEFQVERFGRTAPAAYRRQVQAVFQDPVASLNPAMTVGRILGEPLELHEGLDGPAQRDRAGELLGLVGLDASHLDRFPHEFSGGQRQRIAIARALATSPRLIVLDEPVSALDVSTQASVINLLEEIQERTGVAYLLIAHDLAVVRHASARIVVMYRGRVVEEGPADRVCEAPAHPYTQLLIASIPDPHPRRQAQRRAERRRLGAVSGPAAGPEGCPFLARCPRAVADCAGSFPAAVAVGAGGSVACFNPVEA